MTMLSDRKFRLLVTLMTVNRVAARNDWLSVDVVVYVYYLRPYHSTAVKHNAGSE